MNELIKYWTPDINKILLMCKIWLHIRILHARINLDFNLQCITLFSAELAQVAEIHIAKYGYFKKDT